MKKRSILAIDSIGALVAGGLTLVSAPLLQSTHHWTLDFARFIALANIGYGLYSGALLLVFLKRNRVPAGLAALLVAGNGLWSIQCFIQAWRLWDEASLLGIGHLVFEGIYVGALAIFEARLFFFPADHSTTIFRTPRPSDPVTTSR